jgi:CHASE3 domain sensor protein
MIFICIVASSISLQNIHSILAKVADVIRSLQAEQNATMLLAPNVETESYYPGLFSRLAEKKTIRTLS